MKLILRPRVLFRKRAYAWTLRIEQSQYYQRPRWDLFQSFSSLTNFAIVSLSWESNYLQSFEG